MITTLTVLGTRPEAVKLAPVLSALAQHPGRIRSLVCVTSQHREMLRPFLDFFGIAADYDLGLMKPDQTLSYVTSQVLAGVEEIVRKEKPDIVIVQGDTTSAFAATLAAYYGSSAVGHVEAGLRSGQLRNPFPEEANRRLIDVLTNLYFTPTARARDNLLREGVPPEQVHVTGNTVVDALRAIVASAAHHNGDLPFRPAPGHRMLLLTGHRRESFGQGFANICNAVRAIADQNPDVEIVYPVHLNPNVREPVFRVLGSHPRVHLLEPLPYLPFVSLMGQAYLVLTDSGGVQEEAAALGIPVLVMRKVTERMEGVEAGVARIVDTDTQSIVSETQRLLDNADEYRAMRHPTDVYGDGHASERIASIILDTFEGSGVAGAAVAGSARSR